MTAPRIIGVDLSLTGTGIAGPGWTDTVTSTGKADATLDQRRARLVTIQRQVLGYCASADADLVVIEGPSLGQARQGGQHDRAGLWWLVVTGLHSLGVPVVQVPPASLKKYATGKGTASKPDMRMALYVRTGVDQADENQVDAAWLRLLGLDLLGHPEIVMPAAHRAALAKVQMPELVSE